MKSSFGAWRQFFFSMKMGPSQAYQRLNYFRALEYDLAARACKPESGEKILELGGGYVNSLALWISSNWDVQLTAIDSAPMEPGTPESLRKQVASTKNLMQWNTGRLQVLAADMRQIPFEDGSFDRVIAVSCLEHLAKGDDAVAAHEIGRVLAPYGRAVITLPFSRTEPIERESWGGPEYTQRHYNHITLSERIIEPSGLTVQSILLAGERWPQIGRALLKFPRPLMKAATVGLFPIMPLLWKIYYKQMQGTFFAGEPVWPDDVRKNAGLMILTLAKSIPMPSTRPMPIFPKKPEITPTHKKAVITEIEMRNAQNETVRTIRAGDPISIIIHFENESFAAAPVIRVQIHTPEGVLAMGANTRRFGITSIHAKGPGKIRLRFDSLNLLAGEYLLCAGVFDDPSPLDRPLDSFDPSSEILPFTVTSSSEQGGGIAYCPHRWEWISEE